MIAFIWTILTIFFLTGMVILLFAVMMFGEYQREKDQYEENEKEESINYIKQRFGMSLIAISLSIGTAALLLIY